MKLGFFVKLKVHGICVRFAMMFLKIACLIEQNICVGHSDDFLLQKIKRESEKHMKSILKLESSRPSSIDSYYGALYNDDDFRRHYEIPLRDDQRDK